MRERNAPAPGNLPRKNKKGEREKIMLGRYESPRRAMREGSSREKEKSDHRSPISVRTGTGSSLEGTPHVDERLTTQNQVGLNQA